MEKQIFFIKDLIKRWGKSTDEIKRRLQSGKLVGRKEVHRTAQGHLMSMWVIDADEVERFEKCYIKARGNKYTREPKISRDVIYPKCGVWLDAKQISTRWGINLESTYRRLHNAHLGQLVQLEGECEPYLRVSYSQLVDYENKKGISPDDGWKECKQKPRKREPLPPFPENGTADEMIEYLKAKTLHDYHDECDAMYKKIAFARNNNKDMTMYSIDTYTLHKPIN